jgi:uncharacterized membrane protein
MPGPRRSTRHWLRLGLALLTFVAAFAVPLRTPLSTRLVLAYWLATSLYAALICRVMARPTRQEMMAYVRHHGSRSWVPIVTAGCLSLASLVLLVYLGAGVSGQPSVRGFHVFVSLAAMLVTWMIMNGVFAMRYAALYYAPLADDLATPRRGLSFPDHELVPDYWDFVYYAFTIGMCYQTSDVLLTSPEMRRQTLVHAIFAFLYVAGILSMLFGTVSNYL